MIPHRGTPKPQRGQQQQPCGRRDADERCGGKRSGGEAVVPKGQRHKTDHYYIHHGDRSAFGSEWIAIKWSLRRKPTTLVQIPPVTDANLRQCRGETRSPSKFHQTHGKFSRRDLPSFAYPFPSAVVSILPHSAAARCNSLCAAPFRPRNDTCAPKCLGQSLVHGEPIVVKEWKCIPCLASRRSSA